MIVFITLCPSISSLSVLGSCQCFIIIVVCFLRLCTVLCCLVYLDSFPLLCVGHLFPLPLATFSVSQYKQPCLFISFLCCIISCSAGLFALCVYLHVSGIAFLIFLEIYMILFFGLSKTDIIKAYK